MIHYVPIKEILKGLIKHPMKQRVLIFLMMKILGFNLLKVPPIQKLIKSSFSALNSHLKELEIELSTNNREWLASDDFTLADISWSVILHRLNECGWYAPLIKDKPSIKNYYDKIVERPCFKKGIVNQSNPNLERGINDLKEVIENNSFIRSFHQEINELTK